MKKIAAIALVALAIAGIVRCATQAPEGVQPIAWNSEACAHCHMLIGDPAFAAQVITKDDEVLSFDDPGCASRYLRAHRPDVHHAWFHEGHGQRWLAEADVAFVRVPASPMGSGFMAVAKGTPGSVALEQLP